MWAMDYDSAANYWVEKDRESVAMGPEALFSRIEAFLAIHNTCALATASEDMVRCTPIEYNYLAEIIDRCPTKALMYELKE